MPSPAAFGRGPVGSLLASESKPNVTPGQAAYLGDPVPRLGSTQRQVILLLRRSPGDTIQQVADQLKFTHASATYALNQLRRKGLVVQRRDGRSKRNFLAADLKGGALPTLSPFLADPRKRHMLDLLVEQPHRQLTVNWLAQRIGASHSFVMRCLPALVGEGFVSSHRTPDRHYVRSEPKLVAHLAKEPSRGAVLDFTALPQDDGTATTAPAEAEVAVTETGKEAGNGEKEAGWVQNRNSLLGRQVIS